MQQKQPSSVHRDIRAARYALLLILVFSVLNLVLLIVDRSRFFLFSLAVPYYLTLLALGIDNGFTPLRWSEIGSFTQNALVISGMILAVYLLLLLLSRKRPGFLLGALVLFVLDTGALVGLTLLLVSHPWAKLMDLFLHVWAITELWKGVAAHRGCRRSAGETDGGEFPADEGELMNY